METRKIALKKLVMNDGRIPGLPRNPRKWTTREMENLKRSLEETPELTEARGCIVVPHGKEYVILGGNMRAEAARALGWKEITCVVLPAGTAPEKLREIVLKDNSSFGQWDTTMLLEEWVDDGLIRKLDIYVGEIFSGSYAVEFSMLKRMYERHPGLGRYALFRNHSKVYAGEGPKFAFGIQTSANINTNPRTENASVTIDRGIYEFYRKYYDGIKSFE